MSNSFKRNKKLAVPFLVPSLLVYIIFFIYPALSGLFYSFFDYKGFSRDKTFIGISNFVEALSDKIFWSALVVNLKIMFFGGLFIFLLAFVFLIIFQCIGHFKGTIRALLFLPNIISPVAICILWGFVFNQNFGLLNNILTSMGLENLIVPWLDPEHIMGSLIFVIVWTYVGFYFVILLSGVSKIPDSVYESAILEGASPIQTFFKITVPMIWDVFTVAVVYWLITSLKMFELPFSFTGFKPRMEIWNLPIYIYMLGFGRSDAIYRIGYAAAIAVFLSIIVMIFVQISRKLMSRESIEY